MEAMNRRVTWVIESEIFSDQHQGLREAIAAASHEAISWHDAWLLDGSFPALAGSVAVFHGSLGNAAHVANHLSWRPGAYCKAAAFQCSSWYSRAGNWLLHRQWVATTATELAGDPKRALAPLGVPERFFVRPDSPLKPFSGRVLGLHEVSLQALDHGFYYDDENLPVVVAPVRELAREWRYVIVNGEVVAGSGYTSDRRPIAEASNAASWKFAGRVAAQLDEPESVYVMDVCECDGELWLLELNPFSGADLYACDRGAIVDAVSRQALLDAAEGG